MRHESEESGDPWVAELRGRWAPRAPDADTFWQSMRRREAAQARQRGAGVALVIAALVVGALWLGARDEEARLAVDTPSPALVSDGSSPPTEREAPARPSGEAPSDEVERASELASAWTWLEGWFAAPDDDDAYWPEEVALLWELIDPW